MGDFLQVTGEKFRTKQGQPTLKATDLKLLSKAIRPLPEQFHGLVNTEKRYRQRELDLIANESSRNIVKVRSKMLGLLRSYFENAGFLEVETPILQPIAGGATAKPFITHHNTLNTDLYLRVAPELYLKRLIVGGFEKVYEVARCFRNEGISPQHNPEFTQIECYAAYWDYQVMMKFCEELLVRIVDEIMGKLEIVIDGKHIDFTPPLPRESFTQLLQKATGLEVTSASDKELEKAVAKHGGDAGKNPNRGKFIDELWKTTVRPKILRPTFIIDYPVELSPLAKRSEKNPKLLEMFRLVIAGSEVIKAFTELNDPVDQRQRFTEQDILRKKGDEEAQGNDPAFLTSLEYGMPPTAGAGIGIDRLAAILSGSHNIKEVILFPTLRPERIQE
jgi:lysyl-tRNA synthetase class 2